MSVQQRRKYDPDFKRNSVQLSNEPSLGLSLNPAFLLFYNNPSFWFGQHLSDNSCIFHTFFL
jgi:hypothetical protein